MFCFYSYFPTIVIRDKISQHINIECTRHLFVVVRVLKEGTKQSNTFTTLYSFISLYRRKIPRSEEYSPRTYSPVQTITHPSDQLNRCERSVVTKKTRCGRRILMGPYVTSPHWVSGWVGLISPWFYSKVPLNVVTTT